VRASARAIWESVADEKYLTPVNVWVGGRIEVVDVEEEGADGSKRVAIVSVWETSEPPGLWRKFVNINI
jgi:hypothetical protein